MGSNSTRDSMANSMSCHKANIALRDMKVSNKTGTCVDIIFTYFPRESGNGDPLRINSKSIACTMSWNISKGSSEYPRTGGITPTCNEPGKLRNLNACQIISRGCMPGSTHTFTPWRWQKITLLLYNHHDFRHGGKVFHYLYLDDNKFVPDHIEQVAKNMCNKNEVVRKIIMAKYKAITKAQKLTVTYMSASQVDVYI